MNQEGLAGWNELEERLKLWRTRWMVTKKMWRTRWMITQKIIQIKSQEENERRVKKIKYKED